LQDLRATITFKPPSDLTEDAVLEALEGTLPDWGPAVAVNLPHNEARTFDITVSQRADSPFTLLKLVEYKLAMLFWRWHLDQTAIVALDVSAAD
jgi:hypothetical protein